jgi:hypothetical protein
MNNEGLMKLKQKDVQKLVDEILRSIPHEECRTCDCFLGFITQLELDAQEDVSTIANPLKVSRDRMHSCLGCNPCPPAEAHSDYIRKNQNRKKLRPLLE